MTTVLRSLILLFAPQALVLVQSPALASELEALQECFAATKPFSKLSPGDNIALTEKVPSAELEHAKRPTVMVPGESDGRSGIWIYTDQRVYFQPEPKDRESRIYGYQFELELKDRFPFRCRLSESAPDFESLQRKFYRKQVTCESPDRWHSRKTVLGNRFRKARPAVIEVDDASLAALRTALFLRIGELRSQFRREVDGYRERLEEHQRCIQETGLSSFLRNYAGMGSFAPFEPGRNRYLKALEACSKTDHEMLRSTVKETIKFVQGYSIPSSLAPSQCPRE